jgi:hypothetical protein
MFSSSKDLVAFGEAILEHRLLSSRKTRQWLQPQAHISATSFSVGSPWEISRSDTLTTDGRTIDIYTKTGDLGLYHGVLALVPDYDIVVSVLTGGPEVTVESASRTIILSAVLEALVPAFERAGRDETAATGYVGTFTDQRTNSTIILKTDTGPGLVIGSFIARGFDVLGHFGSYSLAALESGGAAAAQATQAEGRLYPSNRVGRQGDDEETVWRAVIETTTEAQRNALDAKVFYRNGSCVTWFGMDRSAHNFLSLQDIIIIKGGDGTVRAIRSPAFNLTMAKISSETGAVPAGAGVLAAAAPRVSNSGFAVAAGALLVVLNSL